MRTIQMKGNSSSADQWWLVGVRVLCAMSKGSALKENEGEGEGDGDDNSASEDASVGVGVAVWNILMCVMYISIT